MIFTMFSIPMILLRMPCFVTSTVKQMCLPPDWRDKATPEQLALLGPKPHMATQQLIHYCAEHNKPKVIVYMPAAESYLACPDCRKRKGYLTDEQYLATLKQQTLI